jgi:hypothetical protein
MAKIPAQGTTFTFEDSLSAAQTVGEIISYSGFDGEATEEDVTTLSSTAIERRLGLQDHGNFTIELFYDRNDVGQAAMHEARAAAASRECVLVLSAGTIKTATFNALVKNFPISGGKDESLKTSVTLAVDGDVTWT